MSQGQSNPSYPISTSSKQSIIFPGDYALADEGSFFVATQAATAATAVACTTQALGDTNPILGINNSWPVGANSMNIYLRYIKMVTTVVPGSNTSINYSLVLDNLAAKLSTLGTALAAPSNVNSSSGVLSKAVLYGGVNIAAAATTQVRRVGAGQVLGGLGVALDETIFHFGQPVFAGDVNGTITNVKRLSISCAPVIIAPGWWLTLGIWGAGQAASAAQYSFEIGYSERPSGQ